MSAGPHAARLGRLVRTLVDAGMLDAEAVLDNRVAVRDLSRSNPVGLVHIDERPVMVVKEAGDRDATAAEAAAYRWLASSPAAAVAPQLVGGAGDRAVVTRPVPRAVSLHEELGRAPDTADTLVATLGGLLGRVHSARVEPWQLPAGRPWILDVPSGRVPAMLEGHGEALGMVDAVRGRPAVVAAIRAVDRSWTPRAAIHGDVKFDNVLVAPGGMWLVDWEHAVRGEPVWDLAGVADGVLLPVLLGGSADAPHPALIRELIEPALLAHRAVAGPRLAPAMGRVAVATVARLAQTAVQLAAMASAGEETAAAARSVLDAATELAGPAVRRRVRVAP